MIRKSWAINGFILVVVSGGLLFFILSSSCDKKQHSSQDSSPLKIQLPDAKTGKYADQPVQQYIKQHGKNLAKQKQFMPKIELFRRLLKKDPQNQNLQKQLGMLQFYVGDYQKAQPLLKNLENTSLVDAELFYALSKIAWVQNNSDKAQDYLGHAFKLNPQHVQALELSKKIKNPPLPKRE